MGSLGWRAQMQKVLSESGRRRGRRRVPVAVVCAHNRWRQNLQSCYVGIPTMYSWLRVMVHSSTSTLERTLIGSGGWRCNGRYGSDNWDQPVPVVLFSNRE
jgi:hypothetical protein